MRDRVRRASVLSSNLTEHARSFFQAFVSELFGKLVEILQVQFGFFSFHIRIIDFHGCLIEENKKSSIMQIIEKIRPISTVIDLNTNSDFFHCNFNYFNTYSRIIFLIRQP